MPRTREKCDREPRQREREAAHEASQQEEADGSLVERRAGASEARKRKVAVVELSSGSADAPRVSRDAAGAHGRCRSCPAVSQIMGGGWCGL